MLTRGNLGAPPAVGKAKPGMADGGASMVRIFLFAFAFAVLALGTAAYAGCSSCFTSVFAHRTPTSIDLTFTAQTTDDTVLPDSVVAVVMQVDGNRTKCLNTVVS